MKKEESFENLISSIIENICDGNYRNCVSRHESSIKEMIAESFNLMEHINDNSIPNHEKIMMLATIMANAAIVDVKGLSTLSIEELDKYNHLINDAVGTLAAYSHLFNTSLNAKIKSITEPKDNYDNMSKEELIKLLRNKK